MEIHTDLNYMALRLHGCICMNHLDDVNNAYDLSFSDFIIIPGRHFLLIAL